MPFLTTSEGFTLYVRNHYTYINKNTRIDGVGYIRCVYGVISNVTAVFAKGTKNKYIYFKAFLCQKNVTKKSLNTMLLYITLFECLRPTFITQT